MQNVKCKIKNVSAFICVNLRFHKILRTEN